MAKKRIGNFVDHDNGTITDTRTGLMWMRCALGQIWQYGTCCGTAHAYSLSQLTTLLPFHYASYSNWRLPTHYELVKIVDPRQMPSLDSEAFPNQCGKYFWTSSSSYNHPAHALVVSLFSGKIGSGCYDKGIYHVRLVREEANLSGVGTTFAAAGSEEIEAIRKALEPRLAEWTHRSPDTMLGQGKFLLTHTIDLESICMALKLLSMSRTNEANYLLTNFYLAHASEQELVSFLTLEEWGAAGVVSGNVFANENLNEAAEHHETHAEESAKPASEHAVALVQSAIELLRQNPTAFLPQLADLRDIVFNTGVATVALSASSNELARSSGVPSLNTIARWLLDQKCVTVANLRNYLLPFDLLPSAVIDELNERALDSVGEPALEEVDDEIMVVRSVLAETLSLWSKAADQARQEE